MKPARALSSLISCAAAAALAGCATLNGGGTGLPATSAPMGVAPAAAARAGPAASPAPLAGIPCGASSGPPDFSGAIEQMRSAVVGISAVKIVSIEDDDPDAGEDRELLADLLRERGIPLVQRKPPRVALRDQGSGVVVTPDGYILTAAHVVDGAVVVTVELRDGRQLAGRIVGVDLPTDVAVLKIEARDLPTAHLGESSRIKPGSWIAAIGSPFGLKGSAAVGVVSALDRTLPGDEAYIPFIQTDLALNPGNSGGPLLDARGEVVGINSQIAMGENGETGVSFAIPIEIARGVEVELMRAGRVERGDLGMAFQDLDSELARAFGRSTTGGALIHTIRPDGPAARADLRPGDIVLELDGREVAGARELANEIAAHRPGSAALLGIWRAHALLRVAVRIEQSEASALRIKPSTGSAAEPPPRVLSVRELTPKERRALATSGQLLVTGLSAPAAAAGIEMGDIVLGTEGGALRSADELSRALARSSGVLALLIEHEGMRTFVAVPLGAERHPSQFRPR